MTYFSREHRLLAFQGMETPREAVLPSPEQPDEQAPMDIEANAKQRTERAAKILSDRELRPAVLRPLTLREFRETQAAFLKNMADADMDFASFSRSPTIEEFNEAFDKAWKNADAKRNEAIADFQAALDRLPPEVRADVMGGGPLSYVEAHTGLRQNIVLQPRVARVDVARTTKSDMENLVQAIRRFWPRVDATDLRATRYRQTMQVLMNRVKERASPEERQKMAGRYEGLVDSDGTRWVLVVNAGEGQRFLAENQPDFATAQPQ